MDSDNRQISLYVENGGVVTKYNGKIGLDFRIDLETIIRIITEIRKAVCHGKRSDQGA